MYLSSYRLGTRADELEKWANFIGNHKAFFIPNAVDAYPDRERKTESLRGSVAELEELGYEVETLDLKDYFGKETELAEKLKKAHTIFACGGNTFVLRLAMGLSGFGDFLKSKIRDSGLLYGGFSAGICLLGQTLRGLELVDDSTVKPYGDHQVVWDGIGLLGYTPVPHFMSDHFESEAVNDVVDYMRENDIAFKTLRDGDVILLDTKDGKVEEVLAYDIRSALCV